MIRLPSSVPRLLSKVNQINATRSLSSNLKKVGQLTTSRITSNVPSSSATLFSSTPSLLSSSCSMLIGKPITSVSLLLNLRRNYSPAAAKKKTATKKKTTTRKVASKKKTVAKRSTSSKKKTVRRKTGATKSAKKVVRKRVASKSSKPKKVFKGVRNWVKVPKKQCSPYIAFVRENLEVKSMEEANKKVKELAAKWKEMSDDQKKKYVELSEMDKKRYKKEVKEFFENRTDLQIKHQKISPALKKLDPKYKKRDIKSGYFLFIQENKSKYTKDVIASLAKEWSALSESEKKKYNERAKD